MQTGILKFCHFSPSAHSAPTFHPQDVSNSYLTTAFSLASLIAQLVKNLPAMQETPV